MAQLRLKSRKPLRLLLKNSARLGHPLILIPVLANPREHWMETMAWLVTNITIHKITDNYMTDKEWAKEDLLDILVEIWEESAPKLDERGWLEVFPECKPMLIRETKKHIKELAGKMQEIIVETRAVKGKHFSDEFWREKILANLAAHHASIEKKWKAEKFLLNTLLGREKEGAIGPDEIARAKAVPLTNFITDYKSKGGRLWALCPFHSEKSPSFCIDKNNRYHCFGCNEDGDVIEFIQKKNNIEFLDAVKELI